MPWKTAIFTTLWIVLTVPTVGAKPTTIDFDVVIVGGTPGGIMAAIAAARGGHSALILERTRHLGGLPANGLGATDIGTRGATAGLFAEFIQQVKNHYTAQYGISSPQLSDCDDGYHFEPRVAEKIFTEMVAEYPAEIKVLKERQFDAVPDNVILTGRRVTGIVVLNRVSGEREEYKGKVFIDATYEGDLAAAAGADFRLGREGWSEFEEPMSGRLYRRWSPPENGKGSTGLGDNAVQAYNYRLCLTRDRTNMASIEKPENYRSEEYMTLVEDIIGNRTTGDYGSEMAFDGIGRIVNMVQLPNGKTDANNQHLAFISTDLPEENWPWPTSGWEWRDRYAQRLRDYTLGLLWFAQNHPQLPEDFRKRCLEWGLARDEYVDNDNFPRQVYVREGRRIHGEYLFTAHDALPQSPGGRPPIHLTSVTSSHYSLDSHAVRKREDGRVHLDGFFSYPTRPYTVPYGVIVPERVDGLLIPVPVSGTHIGFSTLRMEPCWMALGQAAGVAASIAIRENSELREIDVASLQHGLLRQGAVLIYFEDIGPGANHFEALQYFALRGFLKPSEWRANLRTPVDPDTASDWIQWAGLKGTYGYEAGTTTRGELLSALYREVMRDPGRVVKGKAAQTME